MTVSDSEVRDHNLLGAIGAMAKAGAGLLADLLARLVTGLQGAMLAPLTLALGCQQAGEAADLKAQPAVSEVAPADPPKDDGPRKLGKFNITFYYVAGEEEVVARRSKAKSNAANENDAANNPADLAAITPPDVVPIYTKNCEPIAEVSPAFAQELRVQGTGKLKDGRVLNVWGPCGCEKSPCYKVIEHQWGNAGNGRALQPFRTVAVDPKLIKLGSLLYVPLLEGRTMPGRPPWGGFVHDGCVVADDTGGGIKDHQLDLFVGKRGWFLGLSGSRGSHSWARGVPVYDGSKLCQRKGRQVARKAGGV